jgi:two-component SAPR family response regulator
MNLFRSEEHIRNWGRFDPAITEGILSLSELVKLFSGSYFRRRLDLDWVSHSREYVREMVTTLAELGRTGPFWKRPKP